MVSLTAGQPTASFNLTGVSGSSPATHTVVAGTNTILASATYATPASCTTAPQLSLQKLVDKSQAVAGDVLTYTVIVTNSGTLAVGNVTVNDSLDAALQYVPNSATISSGIFTAGTPNRWSQIVLAGSGNATLVYKATVLPHSEGVLYNTATVPGDTVKVCTSVPIQVCAGQPFAIGLTAPAGYSSYQWLRDGVVVSQTTVNSYTATVIGKYTIIADKGSCPDGTCCPVIIEEVSVPNTLMVVATTPGCLNNVAQTNGQLTLVGSVTATYTYQYSTGSTFNSATASTVAPVTGNGVLATTLAGGQSYTVRVFTSLGCYRDMTVLVPAAICGCPPVSCTPITVRKVRLVR